MSLAPYPGLTVGIPPARVVPDLEFGKCAPCQTTLASRGARSHFDFNRGYTHSYNLTVQRELPPRIRR